MAYIQIENLKKIYAKKDLEVEVLSGLSLTVERGEFVALMGPSGSGKSTLLNLMGGLDSVTAGVIRIADAELQNMNERQLTNWRSQNVGFIFQMYHLLPVLTAAQNVELPLMLFSMSAKERQERVKIALSTVGLEDRSDHKPSQLSGGQEQRVAIARTIVTDPHLILADEPTGNLDAKSAHDILLLLERLNQEFEKTIIMVTHDRKAASHASRLVHLDKGTLSESDALEEAVTY